MNALEHPHFEKEQHQLTQTIDTLQRMLDEAVPPLGYGANGKAAMSLYHLNLERIADLKQARAKPYMARVDWNSGEERKRESLYIGNVAFPTARIYSWASPLAGDLYYNQKSKKTPGTVLLKRIFEIQNDALHTISDEFVHPSLVEELATVEYADRLLFQLLQQHRQGELHDIIATIQEQQFQIIQTPKDRFLIVQGAPGSGKSSIALHRIAYLLYNNSPELKPQDILVLGPNRMFLGFTASILPALGARQVPQHTFDDWATRIIDTPIQYESQEETLEFLLSPATSRAERAACYRNARNKGSLRMASVLENYADLLYDQILDGREALVCILRQRTSSGGGVILRAGESTIRGSSRETRGDVSVTVELETLHQILDTVRALPRPERRESVIRRVVSTAARMIERELQRRGGDASKTLGVIETAISSQVESYFGTWRDTNIVPLYRRLFRDVELLRRAGHDLFTQEEMELMSLDAPSPRRSFHFSDVAGLLYLKALVAGQSGRRYDHIVVDEAQDISPLHFRVLQMYSRNNAMTILGDLQQGIYTHHGVDDWQQLADAFGIADYDRQHIRESYRSTYQIMTHANTMLRRIGVPAENLAEPIARAGDQPTYRRCTSAEDMVQHVVQTVRAERKSGTASMAILCTTAARSRELAGQLRAHGISDQQLIDGRDTLYDGKLAIMPAYLSKGLEFDTVIVVDADHENYAPDLIDARLLFVALTRAAHRLHICWTGSVTPMLDARQIQVQLQSQDELTRRQPATIGEMARRMGWNADLCTLRLAQADKLSLVRDGTIDEVLLELVLRSLGPLQTADTDDVAIAPLTDDEQHTIQQRVDRATRDPLLRQPLALLQLTYALVRNHLRALNIEEVDVRMTPVEQATMVATLCRAITDGGQVLGAGRWTTRKAVLDAVDAPYREGAAAVLDLLVSYGMVEVESADGSKREGLRLRPEAAISLTVLSLGGKTADLDADFQQQFALFPEPLLDTLSGDDR